ncbi:MAG: amino acid permease, partial [Candidatus Nanopelagicales bacterium]
ETVISQLSRQFFGTGLLYFVISGFTAAILVVAANTAYADFPRLASFMAADSFLPHQLRDLGHRLVFSKGILLLTLAAAGLIIGFGAETSRLIPLYALGVFTSFTLSQAGMVVRWLRNKEPGWRVSVAVNGFGAFVTAIVLGVVTVTKFRDGAWVVVILIPVMIAAFLWVRRQYERVAAELALQPDELVDLNYQAYNRLHNHVIVLVKNIDRRLIRALQYAKTLRADEVEALFVDLTGGDMVATMRERWNEAGFGIKLTVIESPYREVISPVIEYVRTFPRPTKDDIVTVIIPEYAPMNAADAMLHDQTSFWIKQQLFGEEGVIAVDVPYHPSFDEIAEKRGRGGGEPVSKSE